MRRSAASIGSNIAEGCSRRGDCEMSRFLQIAVGSASELEYQFLLAGDLKLINESDHQEAEQQVIEVKRMLTALLHKLRADS